jgi:hypothetical protein
MQERRTKSSQPSPHLRDAENYFGGNVVDVVIIDDMTLHVIEAPGW